MGKVIVKESELRNLIRESVETILKESLGSDIKNAAVNPNFKWYDAINPFTGGFKAVKSGVNTAKNLVNIGKNLKNRYNAYDDLSQRTKTQASALETSKKSLETISGLLDQSISQATELLGAANNATNLEEEYTVKTSTDAAGVGTRTTTDSKGNTNVENINPYDAQAISQKIAKLNELIKQLGDYKKNHDTLHRALGSKGNMKTALKTISTLQKNSVTLANLQKQQAAQQQAPAQQQQNQQQPGLQSV